MQTIILGAFIFFNIMNVTQAEREGRNPDRPPPNATVLAGLQGGLDPDEDSSRKRVTRISSPERWEIKQVIGSEKRAFYFVSNFTSNEMLYIIICFTDDIIRRYRQE